jgi:transposase, IS5 family
MYETDSVRRFAGFSRVPEALPDETAILKFRHILEAHRLDEKLLQAANARLKEKGLLMSKGTMVDATITHAPSSTKKQRDPAMHQIKMGNQWFFGAKIHGQARMSTAVPYTGLR